MRCLKFLVAVFACCGVIASTANAGNPRVTAQKVPGCTKVVAIGKNVYKSNKPHRACSAITCPIDYFEKSPSLLVNDRTLPSAGSATLIDSKGKSLSSCGSLDCRDCSTGVRYVCKSGNTNSMAKAAKADTGSYTGFYKIKTTCVQIPDIGRCIGSTKGLCGTVLH